MYLNGSIWRLNYCTNFFGGGEYLKVLATSNDRLWPWYHCDSCALVPDIRTNLELSLLSEILMWYWHLGTLITVLCFYLVYFCGCSFKRNSEVSIRMKRNTALQPLVTNSIYCCVQMMTTESDSRQVAEAADPVVCSAPGPSQIPLTVSMQRFDGAEAVTGRALHRARSSSRKHVGTCRTSEMYLNEFVCIVHV
jgi:hypothetical protein